MLQNKIISGLLIAGLAGAVAVGCKKDDDKKPTSTGGTGGTTGGTGGTGGITGGTGGTGGTTGGTGGTGGTTGGTGGTTGGTAGEGGIAVTGGSAGDGGVAVTGGVAGEGGEGGGAVESYCHEALFVPLAAAGTSQQFSSDFGADTAADLEGVTVTYTFRAVTAGNAGGLQFYVTDGSDYTTLYRSGWLNLTDASEWMQVEFPVASDGDFDATDVRFVGVQVSAGNEWEGADWGDTTVIVDSIEFSDPAIGDLHLEGTTVTLSAGDYNPIVGSTVTKAVCEEVPDFGGAGGAGGATGGGGAGGAGLVGGAGGVWGGGAGGEGGAEPVVACPGCALLSVPFTDVSQAAAAMIVFSPAVDIDAGSPTLTVRAMAPGATGGILQAFVQQNSGDYAICHQGWVDLTTLGELQDLVIPLDACTNNTAIGRVGLQILTRSDETLWASPTHLYIDSISLEGASGTVGPWEFSTAGSIAQTTYPGNDLLWISNDSPPTGTTLAWIAP